MPSRQPLGPRDANITTYFSKASSKNEIPKPRPTVQPKKDFTTPQTTDEHLNETRKQIAILDQDYPQSTKRRRLIKDSDDEDGECLDDDPNENEEDSQDGDHLASIAIALDSLDSLDSLDNLDSLDSLGTTALAKPEKLQREVVIEEFTSAVAKFNTISPRRLQKLKQYCLGIRALRTEATDQNVYPDPAIDPKVRSTWQSFGDDRVDMDFNKLVVNSVEIFKKHGVDVDPANFVNPSGALSSLLLLCWNYCPVPKNKSNPDYRTTADPMNPCMAFVLSKLGVQRTFEAATTDILMTERWFRRELVPKRGTVEQPYDGHATEIQDAHFNFKDSIVQQATSSLQVELGQRNTSRFIKAAARVSASHQLIRLFEQDIYNRVKYHACIVWDMDGSVERLVFFVVHPHGVFLNSNLAKARLIDTQWTTIAMLCGRASEHPYMAEHLCLPPGLPPHLAFDPNEVKEDWKYLPRHRGVYGLFEMSSWEKTNEYQLPRHQLPEWFWSFASRIPVQFTEPSAGSRSLVSQCLLAWTARREANMSPAQKESRKKHFEVGRPLGTAAAAASGAAAKNAVKARQNLRERCSLLKIPEWPAIRDWVEKHDRRYHTIGKSHLETPGYTDVDAWKVVHFEKYTLGTSWKDIGPVFGRGKDLQKMYKKPSYWSEGYWKAVAEGR